MNENTKQNEKPLAEKVSQNIIDYIKDNELKIGDKLPNEFELAEILSTGRSTIREAVKILISRNVVEIKRGAGTYVSSKEGVADDPLGLSFISDEYNLIEDLLAIRFMIEPEIASLAAKNATEYDILDLIRLCNETEQLILLGEDHFEKDTEFHRAIALSSKNSVVPRLIPIINSAIKVFIDKTNRSLLQETISSHNEIVEAIQNHDVMAAHDAMYLHLVYNRKLINKQRSDNKFNFWEDKL